MTYSHNYKGVVYPRNNSKLFTEGRNKILFVNGVQATFQQCVNKPLSFYSIVIPIAVFSPLPDTARQLVKHGSPISKVNGWPAFDSRQNK